LDSHVGALAKALSNGPARPPVCVKATSHGPRLDYLDAIGEIDGVRCLIGWKTTTSRYPEGPEGLLSLDPQLICYSWISGIPEVALVVFVRKHAELRRQVLERDGWRCQDCGAAKELQVHHIKSRSRLGGDVMENLITLCARCHRKRHGGYR
jgi:hypothetical protein